MRVFGREKQTFYENASFKCMCCLHRVSMCPALLLATVLDLRTVLTVDWPGLAYKSCALGAALGTRGGGYLFKHHTHLARDARTFSHFFRGTGLESLTSVPVVHCKDAWACVLRHRDGWKVSFSGDTRPCDEFVVASRGSDLLIHEATFESKYSAHAHKKRHCTISEALRVSDEVGATCTDTITFTVSTPPTIVIIVTLR